MNDNEKPPLMTCAKCGGSDIRISHRGDPFCAPCTACPCAGCAKDRALTRERAREWLRGDLDRIDDDDVTTYRDGDTHRAALYTAIDDHDSDYGDGRLWDALADLLVDAAAGRVR